jgi:hypothetical protein
MEITATGRRPRLIDFSSRGGCDAHHKTVDFFRGHFVSDIAAAYVDRIHRGARPADLPVQQSTMHGPLAGGGKWVQSSETVRVHHTARQHDIDVWNDSAELLPIRNGIDA